MGAPNRELDTAVGPSFHLAHPHRLHRPRVAYLVACNMCQRRCPIVVRNLSNLNSVLLSHWHDASGEILVFE